MKINKVIVRMENIPSNDIGAYKFSSISCDEGFAFVLGEESDLHYT
jgi:hypothetical protein